MLHHTQDTGKQAQQVAVVSFSFGSIGYTSGYKWNNLPLSFAQIAVCSSTRTSGYIQIVVPELRLELL